MKKEYVIHKYLREGLSIRSENINYPEGHEKEGRVKGLSVFIKEAFPVYPFLVRANGKVLCILFEKNDYFSDADHDKLTKVVNDYKAIA